LKHPILGLSTWEIKKKHNSFSFWSGISFKFKKKGADAPFSGLVKWLRER
jgi:hypothetical protein